jgi:hypothetical protein
MNYWVGRSFDLNFGSSHFQVDEHNIMTRKPIILKTAVAGPKIVHLVKITLAFEFSVLTLTVPGLHAKNFKILRAFVYLHHFYSR